MTYLLVGVIALQTITIAFLAYHTMRFARIILDVQDSIEESLDVLDKRYASISKVLQIPLFYDSPEIKRVHEDIKASRDSILYVANLIGSTEADTEVQDAR